MEIFKVVKGGRAALKVLLAVDGSENSLRAARLALRFCLLSPEVEVTALYVGPSCHSLFPDPGGCSFIKQKELDQEIEARAEKVFSTLKEIFAPEGKEFRAAVERGNAAEAIARLAREGQYDLVVVGSRGYGEPGGMALGSVAHKVLHLASCPVVVVK